MNHACDPTVADGDVAFDGYSEGPTCVYTLALRSRAGCPAVTDTSYPLPPPGPAIPPPFVNAPFAPYFVRPSWSIGRGGTLSFDLSSFWTHGVDTTYTSPDSVRTAHHDAAICSASPSYRTTLTRFIALQGLTFNFSLAGSAASVCAPKSYLPTANTGSAVVFSRGPAPGGLCPLTNGSSFPCTTDCHVLAVGAPFISLTNPSNPGRGGLTLEWNGVTLNEGTCAFMRAKRVRAFMQVRHNLLQHIHNRPTSLLL